MLKSISPGTRRTALIATSVGVLSAVGLIAIATSVGVLSAVGLIAYFGLNQTAKDWARPAYPSVTHVVSRGATLDSVSAEHQTPAIAVAMFNNGELARQFPEVCTESVYSNWPRGRYFCNQKLNLAPASTLVPNQRLRIPAMNTPAGGIGETMAAIGDRGRVVVLIDATSSKSAQRNFDYAAPIANALLRRRQLAGVWVFNGTTMFEYIDRSRAIALDTREHAPLFGAIQGVSIQPIDKVVVVSGTSFDVTMPKEAKPVIGFCTASACEKPMTKIAKSTGGRYVPYRKT